MWTAARAGVVGAESEAPIRTAPAEAASASNATRRIVLPRRASPLRE
tara:strand:- start:664 stop:804 length:141 start_codon:yes stop_codon:yes gene_type:complete